MRKPSIAFAFAAVVLAGGASQFTLAAQDAGKAQAVLAEARKAIGEARLASLKTFSAQAAVTRNVGQMQMNSDVELLLEMPDKYLRSEASSSGPVGFSTSMGFNGDQSLAKAGGSPGGGAMVFRIGPGGPISPNEKPTPEQQAEMSRAAVRSARHDISRLSLGWFAAAHPSVKAEYTYAGEAESADGKAHVIDVKGEDGFAARLFIDQATHLPLMLTYQGPKRVVMTAGPGGQRIVSSAGSAAQGATTQTRPPTDEERKTMADAAQKQIETMRSQPPQMVEYRLYFADWSEVDGIKFPLKVQRAVEGTAEEEWTITRVKVNPKIDAGKFKS